MGYEGRFKNIYELVNLKVPRFFIRNKNCFFQCMGKISCVEFQRFLLKFQNILPIHWKMCSLLICENLWALDLRARKCFWNVPMITDVTAAWALCHQPISPPAITVTAMACWRQPRWVWQASLAHVQWWYVHRYAHQHGSEHAAPEWHAPPTGNQGGSNQTTIQPNNIKGLRN